MASDPTVSRLIDTLAGGGERALKALRRARADVRQRVWALAGDADGQVTVDLGGVLVLAHSDKQDAAPTWKKTFGHHPLMGFVDHGGGGSGEPPPTRSDIRATSLTTTSNMKPGWGRYAAPTGTV